MYKESILINFKVEGFLKMIENMVNHKAESFMRKYLIDSLVTFFDLNAPLMKGICDKFAKDEIIEINIWYASTNIQNSSVKKMLVYLDHLCEEISSISHQNELFKNHLIDLFNNHFMHEQQQENKDKEEIKLASENKEIIFMNKIRNLTINNIVHELLDKLVFYQKVLLV